MIAKPTEAPLHILYAVHGYKPAYRVGGPILSVSAAAETLVRKGHQVTVFTTNSNLDEDLDVPVDLVVYSAAVPRSEPELMLAEERGIPMMTRGQLLAALTSDRRLVAVAGAHGKTTTSGLAAELLLHAGRSLPEAVMMMIPEAWQNQKGMPEDKRAFYEYHSMHMEPWDGPAGIVLTDGRYAACVMDRNGLRPARYVITKDRHITLASEIGVYAYDPADVVSKGRLRPGEMIAADTATGELLLPQDIDNLLKARQPYRQWLKENARPLTPRLVDGGADAEALSAPHNIEGWGICVSRSEEFG